MYTIKPYQGFDDIKFGYTSTEIQEYMGIKPSKFKKSPYDINETDSYKDLFVYYDAENKCEAIEFNNNSNLIFRNISFFGEKYVDVEKKFKQLDSKIEIDEVGFNSFKYGIGVYVPNKDEDEAKIESVIIYKKGYYN